MCKTYVLDTNVLIHDPGALFKFEEHTVVIPMTVIEELDGLKKAAGQVGAHARAALRSIDALRSEAHLYDGVELDSGGTLQVMPCTDSALMELPPDMDPEVADNRILALTKKIKADNPPGATVILVTKDANVRIKANALYVFAQDYRNDKVDYTHLYPGWAWLKVPGVTVDGFYKSGELSGEYAQGFEPNQCVILIDELSGTSHSALCRYDQKTNRLVNVNGKIRAMDLTPRNVEQTFALDMLMNPDIKLVTLVGQAGTGKTLLALAAGLQSVIEDGTYSKVLVTRPVMPMGAQDIGFLPGTEEEKLAPWMRPIKDNIEVLLGGQPGIKSTGHKEKIGRGISPMDMLKDSGQLEVGALSFIRGRSIPGQYMVIDEVQNLSPLELKTIITRAGEGTKIVVTGDPEQIDAPYLDAESNGLTYVVERFRDQAIAGHITLTKGERSELAEIAAKVL